MEGVQMKVDYEEIKKYSREQHDEGKVPDFDVEWADDFTMHLQFNNSKHRFIMDFPDDGSYEKDGLLPTIICFRDPVNGELASYSFLDDNRVTVQYKKFINSRRDNYRPDMGMKNILKLLHRQIKEETGVACLPEYSPPKPRTEEKEERKRASRIMEDQPKITDFFSA